MSAPLDWTIVGWVALGAAAGAPLRYVTGHYLDRKLHWGTLTVNVLGSFILGALAAHTKDATALALWGTGFCGGLTTYSSFAVQAINAGPRRGTRYVIVTIAGCLLAAWLGYLS